ncbi:hypothetical protein Tco_0561919, partial [Tanacetum coccineum]
PRILGVGYKLNGVEAKVDDYDELEDSMRRWKDVCDDPKDALTRLLNRLGSAEK